MQSKYRAYICCGPNCGPKGSRDLLDALVEEVEQAGLADQVSVLPTGCQNHCESGPTMVVYPGPVFYQEVDAERLHRIVHEHFIEDRPVKEYFWVGHRPHKHKQALRSPLDLAAPGELPGSLRALYQHRRMGHPKKPKRRYEDVDDFKW